MIRERRIPSDKSVEVARVLESLIDFDQASMIVEVGCGRGRLARLMARLMEGQGHVLALDTSKEVLGLAAREARAAGVSNVTFDVGDVCRLRLPEDSADVVVCSSLLCSLTEVDAAVREMVRITRGGGVVAIAEPAGEQRCYDPDSRRFTYLSNKLNSAFARGWKRRGADQHVGMRVPEILLRHGIRQIAAEVVCQVFLMNDPRRSPEDIEAQLEAESSPLPESTKGLLGRGGMTRREIREHHAIARRRLANFTASRNALPSSGYLRVMSPLIVFAGRIPE